MKGDFSRDTFDPRRRFSRVLLQTGRLLIDADWNEQAAILLHTLRSAISDFAGGVAAIGDAFLIEPLLESDGNARSNDFLIAPGHLYVDGILCENDHEHLRFTAQPDLPVEQDPRLDVTYLVYLDVWERHITPVQDDRIRDVALGGPDTATRARVVWQVKLHEVEPATRCTDVEGAWDDLVEAWQARCRGALQARSKECAAVDDASRVSEARAGYRGSENHLYRVEIHRAGRAGGATFKWSRENASVVFPIRSLTGGLARVVTLGPDDRPSIEAGSWVEIEDDRSVLLGRAGELAQVQSIDRIERSLRLRARGGSISASYGEGGPLHPLLRRWDHRHGVEDGGEESGDGALQLAEDVWIALEDGIEVRFDPGTGHRYRTGDYWLIPARTATRDVEWPRDQRGVPCAQPPHGVTHHYAPLAVIARSGGVLTVEDCLETRRRRSR
jgi:hypothetical protein